MHKKGSVSVDFFRTVTGEPRVELIEDPHGQAEVRKVLRVERLADILTCRDCWADPAVQAALKEARRTGRLERP